MSKGLIRQPGLAVTVIALTCGLLFAKPAGAQTQASRPDANTDEFAADAIKCAWKTDKSAVHVAEQFTLTLTCGVKETRGARIVPKMEDLDPGAVQLAPFEVVSGNRNEDIQAPPWRYFQYEYKLRLIDDDAFGEDEDVPALTITYNVKSDVAGASEGRDQMYVLPELPIRIMSLVPKKADDIRDSARESFAAPKARLFRANADFISAGILFGFSVLMLAFAVVRVIRRNKERAPVRSPVLSEVRVVRACLQEIGRLRSEVMRSGWTPERAGSALTVLRIGSAVAMGRPVSQASVDANVPCREGQIAVRKGLFKRERIVVSSPITPDLIERYRLNGNGRVTNVRTKALIDDLCKALLTFSVVRYGRNDSIEAAGLNRALESARTAVKRLLVTTLWPVRAAASLFQSADVLRASIWTR